MFLGKENPDEQANIHMFKVGTYHEYTLDLYYLIWTLRIFLQGNALVSYTGYNIQQESIERECLTFCSISSNRTFTGSHAIWNI